MSLRTMSTGTRATGLLLVALLAAALPSAPAVALSNAWTTVVPVPLPTSSTSAALHDVSAVSATDVWTVGGWSDTAKHTLAAHWDGAGWTVATTPDGDGAGSRYALSAVDALATHDVWVAGSNESLVDSSRVTNPLVLHYDGVRWAVVVTPQTQFGSDRSVLDDLDMLSTTDGWAVGSTATGGKLARPLILRWQAGQWTPPEVLLPGAMVSGELTAVSARSADDVWAVGSQVLADGSTANLVMHFNGAVWQAVAVPGQSSAHSTLAAVAALSADEVWAVGRSCVTVQGTEVCVPQVLRLFAGAWQVIPSAGGAELTAVVARSSSDVWAIGYSGADPTRDGDFAEHWDGQRFTVDDGPIVSPPEGQGQPGSALEAATAAPGTGQIWAVGWAAEPKRIGTHVVRRD